MSQTDLTAGLDFAGVDDFLQRGMVFIFGVVFGPVGDAGQLDQALLLRRRRPHVIRVEVTPLRQRIRIL